MSESKENKKRNTSDGEYMKDYTDISNTQSIPSYGSSEDVNLDLDATIKQLFSTIKGAYLDKDIARELKKQLKFAKASGNKQYLLTKMVTSMIETYGEKKMIEFVQQDKDLNNLISETKVEGDIQRIVWSQNSSTSHILVDASCTSDDKDGIITITFDGSGYVDWIPKDKDFSQRQRFEVALGDSLTIREKDIKLIIKSKTPKPYQSPDNPVHYQTKQNPPLITGPPNSITP